MAQQFVCSGSSPTVWPNKLRTPIAKPSANSSGPWTAPWPTQNTLLSACSCESGSKGRDRRGPASSQRSWLLAALPGTARRRKPPLLQTDLESARMDFPEHPDPGPEHTSASGTAATTRFEQKHYEDWRISQSRLEKSNSTPAQQEQTKRSRVSPLTADHVCLVTWLWNKLMLVWHQHPQDSFMSLKIHC